MYAVVLAVSLIGWGEPAQKAAPLQKAAVQKGYSAQVGCAGGSCALQARPLRAARRAASFPVRVLRGRRARRGC